VSVCIATDRHNKSIITITNQQLFKPVCCSASHRERYRGSFGWIECQGCEGEQRYWGSFGWIECEGCEGEQSYWGSFGWIECQGREGEHSFQCSVVADS